MLISGISIEVLIHDYWDFNSTFSLRSSVFGLRSSVFGLYTPISVGTDLNPEIITLYIYILIGHVCLFVCPGLFSESAGRTRLKLGG